MNQLKPVLNDNVVIGPQSWLKLIIVSSYLILWIIIFPFSKPIPITSTAGACYKENRMRNEELVERNLLVEEELLEN